MGEGTVTSLFTNKSMVYMDKRVISLDLCHKVNGFKLPENIFYPSSVDITIKVFLILLSLLPGSSKQPHWQDPAPVLFPEVVEQFLIISASENAGKRDGTAM